jgi:hypothetical protein
LLCVGYDYVWFLVEDDVAAVMNGEMKQKVKTVNFALVVLQHFFLKQARSISRRFSIIRGLGDKWA